MELELELLTEEEAKLRPAGQGRDEPNAHPHLEAPIRPSTSFNWLLSPLKFLYYLFCKRLRVHFIVGLSLLIIVFILYICISKFMVSWCQDPYHLTTRGVSGHSQQTINSIL